MVVEIQATSSIQIYVSFQKKKRPKVPSDSTPIYSYNAVFTIITKTIVNRLKLILSSITEKFQTIFVLGVINF